MGFIGFPFVIFLLMIGECINMRFVKKRRMNIEKNDYKQEKVCVFLGNNLPLFVVSDYVQIGLYIYKADAYCLIYKVNFLYL